ncbi:MAG: 1-(5-phosphoribosyl)-5-[(5-phosphoribosylamino)methylideneamino]imidazole-4-carboxamide isomerase [Candidatus Omnitrophota bacterium]|nr:1-(5-phosphoribosyl)-5-[(5-phosphoribosylamino)methylideneamino]imidazole-4-carboxamide isomerase [Candidatus Omnitrophota bacterium]
MLIIPAIDILDGCVVRFVQGRIDKKIYSRSPLKTAKHWLKAGASMLHIVDLDGAFSGRPKNLSLVKEIAKNINVPVQFGGGVRSIETIKTLLRSGVWRVILGTKAVTDKAFLKKAFAKFKDRIIVSLDVKDKDVLIKGWKASGKKNNVITCASFLRDLGFREVIYTDTLKDGTLSGPNIKGIKDFLKEAGLNTIASGGISCLNDLHRLKELQHRGLVGVIIGKALYEGKFGLSEALRVAC